MKKKTILILAALIMLVCVIGGSQIYHNSKKNDDLKEVTIIMNNEGEEFYQKVFLTSASYLNELLLEANDNGDIMLEYEDSEYGMYITGLGDKEIIENDPSLNKYWTYVSSNNEMCVSDGYCTGASSLLIGDGDIFVFDYSKFE